MAVLCVCTGRLRVPECTPEEAHCQKVGVGSGLAPLAHSVCQSCSPFL